MSTGGATLQGSFSGATGTIQASGFVWGTDASNLTEDIQLGSQTGASGSLSYSLTGLSAGQTYYYKAYVQVWDSAASDVVTVYGDLQSFTMSQAESGIPGGWLELPQLQGNEDFTGSFYGSGSQAGANRNYSYNYSYTYYAPLWTAYPLTASHKTGNASTNNWHYNPNIAQAYQINMTGSSYPTMYNATNYSKGHMCPDADRKSESLMNQQTYYCTNQAPQIQNGFNGGIWSKLENAVRNLANSTSDTVYVVTGPCYRKVGGSETINYLTANPDKSEAHPDQVPVANYFWKALLKVTWNNGTITNATSIAFWYPHQELKDENYNDSKYIVSVAQIEAWTGFNLFHNLPDGIEATTETNTNWSTFQSF